MDFLFTLLPSSLVSELGTFLTIVTLLFYIAETFFGYRMIRSWISILGFLFGALGGFYLANLLFGQTGYAIAGALIGGILLSALSFKVYLVGVFLIAAYGVFQIGMTLLPLGAEFLTLASAILGLLAGYIAVKNMRPAIIIITALHGGLMAAGKLSLFMTIPAGLSVSAFGVALAIAGILVQSLTSKK